MANIVHSQLTLADIHALTRWQHVDATERLAESLVAADVDKVSHQLDDDTYWILVDLAPTWSQLNAAGGGGSGVIYIHTSASLTANDTNWVGWANSGGPNNAAWTTTRGAQTGDPSLNRTFSGWTIPTSGILSTVRIYCSDASGSAFDYKWELWSVTLTDGDTVDGTKTKVADLSYTGGGANDIVVKDFNIIDSTLVAGDCLVLFCGQETAGAGHLIRIHDFVIGWS